MMQSATPPNRARATQSALATCSTPIGGATGAPAAILRLEGAAALALCVFAYRTGGGGWAPFALLFLVPDLSMLGYLVDRRFGARVYNAGHSYLTPAALAVAGLASGLHGLIGPALIWAAHIGFDRMLGFGLKYPSAFSDTHLGVKGGLTP